MAQPITCDLCEQAPADVMVSNMHDGSTSAMCLTCWAEAGTQLARDVLAAVQAAEADPAGVGDDGPAPQEGSAPVTVADVVGDPGTPPEQETA